VSTFIDVYLGNSTRPLNVDFSRLQHSAPSVDFCRHPHSKELNIALSVQTTVNGIVTTNSNDGLSINL